MWKFLFSFLRRVDSGFWLPGMLAQGDLGIIDISCAVRILSGTRLLVYGPVPCNTSMLFLGRTELLTIYFLFSITKFLRNRFACAVGWEMDGWMDWSVRLIWTNSFLIITVYIIILFWRAIVYYILEAYSSFLSKPGCQYIDLRNSFPLFCLLFLFSHPPWDALIAFLCFTRSLLALSITPRTHESLSVLAIYPALAFDLAVFPSFL